MDVKRKHSGKADSNHVSNQPHVQAAWTKAHVLRISVMGVVITVELLAIPEVLSNSRAACIDLHFPPTTALTVCHRFCFHFHVSNFLISLLIPN